MKKRLLIGSVIVVLAVVFTIVPSASVSAEEAMDKKFSGNWETAFTNMYLGIVGIAVKEEPQLQSQLTLKYGDDRSAWYGSFWMTNSLRDREGFTDEIDVGVGYQRYFEHVTVDGRVSYFAFNDLEEPETDQFVIDFKVALEKVPVVKPYFQFRYFGEIGSQSPDGGFFAFAGLSRSQSLGFSLPWAESKQSLNLGVESLWSFGALGRDAGYVGTKLSASTPIPLTKRSYLTPSVTYLLSAGGQDGGTGDFVDGNKLVYGLAWGIDF